MCPAIWRNTARRHKEHTNEKLADSKNHDNPIRLPKNEGTYAINDAEQRIIKRCPVNQYSHLIPRLKSKTFFLINIYDIENRREPCADYARPFHKKSKVAIITRKSHRYDNSCILLFH